MHMHAQTVSAIQHTRFVFVVLWHAHARADSLCDSTHTLCVRCFVACTCTLRQQTLSVIQHTRFVFVVLWHAHARADTLCDSTHTLCVRCFVACTCTRRHSLLFNTHALCSLFCGMHMHAQTLSAIQHTRFVFVVLWHAHARADTLCDSTHTLCVRCFVACTCTRRQSLRFNTHALCSLFCGMHMHAQTVSAIQHTRFVYVVLWHAHARSDSRHSL